MDSRLTEVLVCPICKGPLHLDRENHQLQCAKCAKGYPIEGDIPVMLENEACDLSEEQVQAARIAPAAH